MSSPFVTLGQVSERLAVLTEVRGDVQVARAGSDTFSPNAAFGTALFANDRLRTGDSGSASILYSSGDLFTVGSNRSIRVTDSNDSSDGSSTRVGVDSRASSSAASLALHRSGDGEIAALSGLRSGNERAKIVVTSPANGAQRTSRPIFNWTTSNDFSVFRVRVFTSTGVVWEKESTSMTLEYPADAPALSAGIDYLVQVIGEDLLDEEKSDISQITVLSQEQLQHIAEVEKSLSELNTDAFSGNYHLLLGSSYADSGLLTEAASEFRALAEEYPDSALPYELLAEVYSQMGRTDLALEFVRKAAANTR